MTVSPLKRKKIQRVTYNNSETIITIPVLFVFSVEIFHIRLVMFMGILNYGKVLLLLIIVTYFSIKYRQISKWILSLE